MKLLFRGFRQRLTQVRSSLGPNDQQQKEFLFWNFYAAPRNGIVASRRRFQVERREGGV